MKRLSTLGLVSLLAFAPAFSGDSPGQGLPVGLDSVLADTLITVTDDFIVDVERLARQIDLGRVAEHLDQ